jgi:hypothetical protein
MGTVTMPGPTRPSTRLKAQLNASEAKAHPIFVFECTG